MKMSVQTKDFRMLDLFMLPLDEAHEFWRAMCALSPNIDERVPRNVLNTIDPHAVFDGWNVYDAVAEFKRQQVNLSIWRCSTANKKYALSNSYPQDIYVPKSISDAQLRQVR